MIYLRDALPSRQRTFLIFLAVAVAIAGGFSAVLSRSNSDRKAPERLSESVPDQPTLRPPLSEKRTTIDQSINFGYGYTKDDTHVYSYGQIVVGADPLTFRLLAIAQPAEGGASDYTADSTHVFLNDVVIPNADPATFEILSLYGEVSKDKRAVYLGHAPVEGATASSFVLLTAPNQGSYPNGHWNPDIRWTWGKDDQTVFVFRIRDDPPEEFAANTIAGAELSSFVPLGDGVAPYSKDGLHVYFLDKTIKVADPATFVIGSNVRGAAKDKNRTYLWGTPQTASQ